MKIALGSDHTGVAARKTVTRLLESLGIECVDFGVPTEEPADYPDVAYPVAKAVADHAVDSGILICGAGNGMGIAANKVPGVRAAVCHNEYTTEMARKHNNANVLCMGARVLPAEMIEKLVKVWLESSFEGGRHQRRVSKVAQIERKVSLTGEPGPKNCGCKTDPS
ncbi:MAG TPA: ribose 5-phosphate isomerase B [Planctomycetota bacterium]|nr:ribose 5-phosphate isomerase B [Planctomycetota bacterium]